MSHDQDVEYHPDHSKHFTDPSGRKHSSTPMHNFFYVSRWYMNRHKPTDSIAWSPRWMQKYHLQCSTYVNLSLRFNGHFPGGPGLAGTRMSPFWILLKLRVMEVVSGDNWSYKTCSQIIINNKPTPNFLQAGCPSCRQTNSFGALKENRFTCKCRINIHLLTITSRGTRSNGHLVHSTCNASCTRIKYRSNQQKHYVAT